MEKNPQRRSTVPGQSSTPSSLRHCLYPSPATTIQSGSKSLRRSSKSKNKSDPPRPAALTRVKGGIAMETPTRMGSGMGAYIPERDVQNNPNRFTEMSWLNDASPMGGTPRTPQRSRSETPGPNATSIVNPSSALLQDLLKEQRATRGARATGADNLEDNSPRTPEWCQTQSHSQSQSQSQSRSQSRSQSQEETGSEKQRKAMAASLRQPREMGVREMDQYISKINKQNFDLKLEIFHRVQQMAALEKKLERMHELEAQLERMNGLEDELEELQAAEEDNQRLRESNEQLRQEIDKRDQAVTEAVELICHLEARVDELGGGADPSRPSTARGPAPDDDLDVATPKNLSTVDIPERTSSKRATILAERRRVSSGSRHLQRAPSFLLEENKSTAVLRSLYVPTDDQPAAPSVIAKSESMKSMTETAEPESPRLSALSECSELNIYDSPVSHDGFDEIEIPVRKREASAETTGLSAATIEGSDRDLVRIDRWIPSPLNEAVPAAIPKQTNRRVSDVFKDTGKPSLESVSFNSSGHKTKLDSLFSSARLPPTPDTMSTAYAGGTNRSSTSTVADKSQLDLKRGLIRARSADELTTRRSSINSGLMESMDANLSDTTLPRVSLDERDEEPAIFPLNALHYGHASGYGLFHGDGFDRFLSKMDKEYYSPSGNTYRGESSTPGSSRPSLTADDWIEAARSGTRSGTERTRTGPLPTNSRLVGSRAPSQSSFLGRRHSIDSAVREPDLPIIQTLNMRSLGADSPVDQQPEPEPRRKISLLPPFFSRSATSRRLQPSPMSDPVDNDDGAPAPIIRKTRNQASRVPRPLSGCDDFAASGPTDADAREDAMSRSFTEANLSSRPSTSNGKDHHKRRGSLGIFGWMKGATLKKSDANTCDTPVTPNSASFSTTGRASSRLATHENATLTPETVKSIDPTVDDFATRTRHPIRTDETADEQGRRPRYMERRRRG